MTPDEAMLDRISNSAHGATLALISGMINVCNEADQEAAVIAGVASAMCEVLWRGRRPGCDKGALNELWRALGDEYFALREREIH